MEWHYKWIERIQDIVAMHTIGKNEVSQGWIFILLLQFMNARNDAWKKSKNKDGDGVMGLAFDLGLILFSWAYRTQLAKCYDPRRPAKERDQAAYQLGKRMLFLTEVFRFEPNKSDKKIYKQKWQPTKFMKELCESAQ